MNRTGRSRRLSGWTVCFGFLALLAVAGCEGPATTQADPQPLRRCGSATGSGPVALAVGARANSAEPARREKSEIVLPASVGAVLQGAADRSAPLTLVRVDGQPDVVGDTLTFSTTAQNEPARDEQRQRWLKTVRGKIADLRAGYPEAAPLAALSVAARSAENGTVVLVDSGLQTVAPLDFGTERLLGADPDEIVGYLKAENLLPDLTGRSVLLVGLGETAGVQKEPNEADRRRLVNLWSKIVNASGGCVAIDGLSRASVELDNVPAVTPVALTEPATPVLSSCGDTVLADTGDVGFQPDKAEYRDPAAARRTLDGIARQINDGDLSIELIGTTATAGTRAQLKALSTRRAETVRATLVDELRVPRSHIVKVHGVGADWPGRVPDLAADGHTLLPGPAARNRSVIIRVRC
jgi:OOP family OmpA-OmpF porin